MGLYTLAVTIKLHHYFTSLYSTFTIYQVIKLYFQQAAHYNFFLISIDLFCLSLYCIRHFCYCDYFFSQNVLSKVGFEPTPQGETATYTLERSALNHSAIVNFYRVVLPLSAAFIFCVC